MATPVMAVPVMARTAVPPSVMAAAVMASSQRGGWNCKRRSSGDRNSEFTQHLRFSHSRNIE
jgi:hypothetical protein